MHSTAEDVYKQLKQAPDELVYEVSDFTDYLMKKKQAKNQSNLSPVTFDSSKGSLKGSPSFEGEPLDIQRRMRNEWD